MSLNSKFSNIRHSIRYKSLQPFKFFILKKRYKKNREIAISLLSSDSLVVEEEDIKEEGLGISLELLFLLCRTTVAAGFVDAE